MTEAVLVGEQVRAARAVIDSEDGQFALIGEFLRRAAREGNARLLMDLAGTVAGLLASLPAGAGPRLDDAALAGPWPGDTVAAAGGPAPAPEPSHAAAGQARRLAIAAYLAASVAGDLGSAEALLAAARRTD